MKASIIIPTYGRPIALRRALQSILAVDPRALDTEVLVVDNNSDAEISADVRAASIAAGAPVRYVPEPSPGLGAARHRGAQEAAGEILIFIDDDVEVSATWLPAIVETFSDPAAGIVGGPSLPKFLASVPAWFWQFVVPAYGGWGTGWLSLLDLGATIVDVNPNMIWGLNFSIRRELLQRLGGFHPDVVPSSLQRWQGDGETGLTMKAQATGVRAVYRQEALLHHMVDADRLTPEYFAKRAAYQAVCDSYTAIRAGAAPAPDHEVPPMPGVLREGRWYEAAKAVLAKTESAYRDAWLFHQREVAADPALLRWVRRETYWDADIREELAAAAVESHSASSCL